MEFKFDTILEYKDKIAELRDRNLAILDECDKIVRSLDESENAEFEANLKAIDELSAEMVEFERKMSDEKTINNLTKISIDKNMENNQFSLYRAISEAYKNREKVVDLKRAYTVASEGEDVVPTDIWEVMRPLMEDRVLGAAGAQIRTGLHDNVQIPIFNEGSAMWKGEIEEAEDGSGSFTQVNLSPKRITCYVPISKQFLIQAVPSAETVIREDIANQMWAQIENLLLSDEAATANSPAGLLNGLTATEIADYKALTELEADLREAKYKNVKAILSPRAEANFKSMIKGTNGTGMVLTDNRLDGLDTYVTSALDSKLFLLGDFSQLVIGFWGNTEIQFIEDSYYAKRGQVCIVLNGYADAKLARADAVVLGTTDVQ